MRLVEFRAFSSQLERVYKALISLAAGEKPDKRGAPATSDAVLFGIKCLEVLWARHQLAVINGSEKREQFGGFVIAFFRLLHPHPIDSEVRTALRKFISKRRSSTPRSPGDTPAV
jgi:hypothetical protein